MPSIYSSISISDIPEKITFLNCQKTGRELAVSGFTNQNLATSSAIWMVGYHEKIFF